MKNVDISVLLVSFNHEKYIERALASISSQLTSYTVEVVIADDKSTDRTLELIRAWRDESELSVRILDTTANLGITRNYERGIQACLGRFIAVLEGDDEWLSVEKLDIQVRFLDTHDDVAVIANRLLIFDEGTGQSTVWPLIGADAFEMRITSQQLAETNWFGTFSTCMFRASALKRVPSEVFEVVSYDWMINMAVTADGDGVLLPEVTALYRVHGRGVWSSQSTPERDLKMQALIPRYMELLGGRLDRQLSAALLATELRLKQTPPDAFRPSLSKGPPSAELAPLIKFPRVVSDVRPLVSVVMVSEDHATVIREAMDSVLQQTMSDLEFIVVDNGSTDRTLDLISRVMDPRIRTFPLRENVGGAAALNVAIQQARGTYVAVINPNDRWELHKLARQLEIFAEKPHLGAVFTGIRIVDERGRPLAPNRIPNWLEAFRQPNRSQGQWLRYFLANGNVLCHSSILVKRRVYEEIGLYDNSLRQLSDYDRWVSLVKHFPIEVLGDEPLVRFRTFREQRNATDLGNQDVVRAYHEHVVVNQRFFEDIPGELLEEGFSDLVRLHFFRTELEIECVAAFLWLDCNGPLSEVNRVQALFDIRRLLRNPRSKLYLRTHFGVQDGYLHELTKQADGAAVLGALQTLRSFRVTPERDVVFAGTFSALLATLKAMRKTPLRKWPQQIRRRLAPTRQ